MAYTFMVMSRHSTSSRAKTFSVPKSLFWFLFVLFVSSPVWGYYLSYYFLAPKLIGHNVADMAADLNETNARVNDLEKQNSTLEKRLEKAAKELAEAQQRRAEAEARTAILETTRSKTSGRLQTLEDEVYDLRRAVELYENLLRPATEKEVLQCFNIAADYTPGSKNIKYNVNFLRVDQEDKSTITAKVRYRVLTGKNALALDQAEGAKVLNTQTLSMVKDARLSGTIAKQLPEDGLRILDVKAYDGSDRVIAHCWKAF